MSVRREEDGVDLARVDQATQLLEGDGAPWLGHYVWGVVGSPVTVIPSPPVGFGRNRSRAGEACQPGVRSSHACPWLTLRPPWGKLVSS